MTSILKQQFKMQYCTANEFKTILSFLRLNFFYRIASWHEKKFQRKKLTISPSPAFFPSFTLRRNVQLKNADLSFLFFHFCSRRENAFCVKKCNSALFSTIIDKYNQQQK